MRRPIVILLAAAALPAAAAISRPSGVAPAISPPSGVEPAFALSASGVQIWQCNALGADGWGWTYVAPDATLYEGSRSIATHKVPDLWESLSDRSSVTAVARANQSAGGGNLSWQLMQAAPLNATGMFAGVTHVQRVNTEGGVPPATGCGAGNVGAESRVPFRADYYFYKRAGTT